MNLQKVIEEGKDEFRKAQRKNILPTADFQLDFLDSFAHRIQQAVLEEVRGKIERIELKQIDRTIKPEVVKFYRDAVEETKRVALNSLQINKEPI